MSNWLGFSLTPHLRIDEEFGRESQNQNQEHHGEGSEIIGRNYVPPSSSHHQHLHNHLSVMPLRSDGSLCVSDTFTHSVTPQGIYICMFL
jgi:AP2-like factor (ANT lineage)